MLQLYLKGKNIKSLVEVQKATMIPVPGIAVTNPAVVALDREGALFIFKGLMIGTCSFFAAPQVTCTLRTLSIR
jgi:hypothetical protein